MTGARMFAVFWVRLFVGFIRLYQLTISRVLPPVCRFYPSCSQYTVVALGRFGPLKGSWLAFRRIIRCHPFNPGGLDPVPEREGPAFFEPRGRP